jgi:hypothetical protein
MSRIGIGARVKLCAPRDGLGRRAAEASWLEVDRTAPVAPLRRELLMRGRDVELDCLRPLLDREQVRERERPRIRRRPSKASSVVSGLRDERRFLGRAIARPERVLSRAHRTYQNAPAAIDAGRTLRSIEAAHGASKHHRAISGDRRPVQSLGARRRWRT